LAVKIVRQPKKIALIGAPSSAAAFAPGSEKAPAALRAAGLVERLQNAGYEVVDYGDCPQRLFADDEEHRRARNLPPIVAGLNDLRTHVEVATKSGAFVLVLGGDCAQSIGLIAGSRRYYKHLNLLWFDRDADLNTPATTPSGRIDGMVVAHILGRGAAELVRFWGEPPLVREPDVTLFGIERLDPPEQDWLSKSPLRQVPAATVRSKGAAAAAKDALAHLHADTREFILHLDLDVIAQEELAAVNVPGSGGLSLAEVRTTLGVLLSHKNLLGLDVAQFNPDKDSDGTAARKIVDVLVEALTARLTEELAPTSSAAEIPAVAPEPAKHLNAAESVPEPGSPASVEAETSAVVERESAPVETPFASESVDVNAAAPPPSSEGETDSLPASENAREATSSDT
jgi:arginase